MRFPSPFPIYFWGIDEPLTNWFSLPGVTPVNIAAREGVLNGQAQ